MTTDKQYWVMLNPYGERVIVVGPALAMGRRRLAGWKFVGLWNPQIEQKEAPNDHHPEP